MIDDGRDDELLLFFRVNFFVVVIVVSPFVARVRMMNMMKEMFKIFANTIPIAAPMMVKVFSLTSIVPVRTKTMHRRMVVPSTVTRTLLKVTIRRFEEQPNM